MGFPLINGIMGGGQNFERPNVKRLIFRNLKITNVKSRERSSYSIFLFTKLFLYFFFNYLNTQILVFFFNFNVPIFYSFSNLIFLNFERFFLINNFCKFINFCKCVNSIIFEFNNYYQIKKLKICKITKILKKLSSFGIVRLFDISHYPQFRQLSFHMNLFRSFIYLVCYFIF